MLLVDVASGFAAGINVTLVGHPFDTIKVRLQTQPTPPIYSGLVDCVKKTAAEEGLAGFYRGVAAPLGAQLFIRTALFTANSGFTRWLQSRQPGQPLSYLQYALGGSFAWSVATVIDAPQNVAASQFQVAKIRLAQGVPAEFAGVGDYLVRAPKKYGVGRALYAGTAPHLIRNAIGGALHFGLFEATRRSIAEARGVPVAEVGLATNLFAGGIGGVAFWSFTYPLDVAKSAMQADHLGAGRQYHGLADTMRKLYAEGGWRRFTRGYSACLARSVPANAVLLTTAFRVKELGTAWLERPALEAA